MTKTFRVSLGPYAFDTWVYVCCTNVVFKKGHHLMLQNIGITQVHMRTRDQDSADLCFLVLTDLNLLVYVSFGYSPNFPSIFPAYTCVLPIGLTTFGISCVRNLVSQ